MYANRKKVASVSLAALTVAGLSLTALPAGAQAMACRDCGGDGDPWPTPPPRPRPQPPKPAYSPALAFDGARQTTDFGHVRVTGWTADADLPTSPLTVDIIEDGNVVATVAADQDRPDVAAVYPAFGARHGFDVTLPASNAAHTMVVRAHNFGSGSDVTASKGMDRINGFLAYAIGYDVDHAQIVASSLQQLSRFDYTNGTTVTQNQEFDLSGSTTEVRGWQDTQSVKVSLQASGGASYPFVAEGKVSVGLEGSLSFQQNGQVQRTKAWTWRQPATIPAMSRVVGTSSLTEYTLRVPYTMTGDYTYESGATAPGSVPGIYSGVNGNGMTVVLRQTSVTTGATVRKTLRVSPSTSYGPEVVVLGDR